MLPCKPCPERLLAGQEKLTYTQNPELHDLLKVSCLLQWRNN
jgi:hypothetical protein